MPYVAPADFPGDCPVDPDAVLTEHGSGPWRRPLLGNHDLRVVLLCWQPGFRTVPHHHPHATETFHVLRGVLGLRIDDRPEAIVAAGGISIAHRGQVHGLRVAGEQPLVFLACVGPNEDVPDEQVDVPDRWSDWVPSSTVPSPDHADARD